MKAATRAWLLVLLTGFLSPIARAQVLYSWDNRNSPSNLARWQVPPSGGTVPIGSASNNSFDIAFSPTGILWGTDGSGVFTINTASGAQGSRIPITNLALNESLIGVTFTPFTPGAQMYGWTLNNNTSRIYRLNPSTGTATVVAFSTPAPLVGLTFSPVGIMYASTGTHLLRLNPATGAVVQDVGAFPQYITSLGFGSADGVMRGLSPTANGTALYRINQQTLASEFLGNSTGKLYGIASFPAPSTVVVFALGGMRLCRRRTRRRAA